jgi:hypothetical protein
VRRAGLRIATLAAVLGDTIYVDVRINSITGKAEVLDNQQRCEDVDQIFPN